MGALIAALATRGRQSVRAEGDEIGGGASVFRTEILEGAEKKWAAKPPTSCLSASQRLRVNKFRRSRRPLREPIPARLSASKSMGDRIAPVASEIARRQFDPRRRLPPLIFGEHHQPLDPRHRVP